jgi:hypothetical protein
MTAKEFEQYKKDSKAILGYMPIRTPCVTCQTPDAKIPKTSKLPSRKCLIRQCVDRTRVPNCAYCSRFPCDTLKETAGAWNREGIEAKLGEPLSEEAYRSFVEPFEGLRRLEDIRSSLEPNEIVEPAKSPVSKTKIVEFPESLSFKDLVAFRAVHKLLADLELSSLGLTDTDTFAQQHKLENQKVHVLRFLWILGNYGKLENKTHLVVDAETFLSNRGKEKKLAILSFVEDAVFKVLSEFGVCSELISSEGMKKDDLTTGTGYLRKKSWVMKMSFDPKVGGVAALEAFQSFVKELDKKYGSRAFRCFRNADMTVLLKT